MTHYVYATLQGRQVYIWWQANIIPVNHTVCILRVSRVSMKLKGLILGLVMLTVSQKKKKKKRKKLLADTNQKLHVRRHSSV